ncbi:hypothetical protein TrLO_g10797 [Triparma laevis f. longispina]|uniref:Uncharacterized protein n=1 Tax=Triparma laevis f. longispina TaxID=1714387 RepID=A0A9W7FR42_9STRA|nr:hypothetical protein TrLO_g10797 [Triparma laevis f. longispina]
MGPKKRDKVPIRKPVSSFSYKLPLGTADKYSHLKKSISLRMSSGYPSSLPSPDEVRESQQKKLDELNKAREEKEGKVSDEVVKKEEKITSLEGMKERYNTLEINKINKEIEKLQSKKKEFFWLLKQVITVEAQRKRTETVKGKDEPKPKMGMGGIGMGGGGMGVGLGGMGGGKP